MPEGQLSGIERLEREVVALELELEANADWRALRQLEAREARGEALTAVSAAELRTFLMMRLELDPLYGRWHARRRDLERLAVAPAAFKSGRSTTDGDDLTRIEGINNNLARRLHALDVWEFEQIANWTGADVRYVASTLGLRGAIVAQDWIGQAAALVAHSPGRSRASFHWSHAKDQSKDGASGAVNGLDERPGNKNAPDAPVRQNIPPVEFDLTPPLPLAAWHYAGPAESGMSLIEASAILGLSERDVRVLPRKVPLPAAASTYATVPASGLNGEAAAPRADHVATYPLGVPPGPLVPARYAIVVPEALPWPAMPLPAWAYDPPASPAVDTSEDVNACPQPKVAVPCPQIVPEVSEEPALRAPSDGIEGASGSSVAAPAAVRSAPRQAVEAAPDGQLRLQAIERPPPLPVSPAEHFDARGYAGYRQTIEEAEVRIVGAQGQDGAGSERSSSGAEASVPAARPRGAFGRLLKALTRS